MPSGLFPDVTYDTYRMKLEPGDAVLFSTDGIHELQNAKGEDISWHMLGDFWRHAREKGADEALDHLFESIDPYAGHGQRKRRHHGCGAENYRLAFAFDHDFQVRRDAVADRIGAHFRRAVRVQRGDHVRHFRIVGFSNVAFRRPRRAVWMRVINSR